jgi:hypothetical protein
MLLLPDESIGNRSIGLTANLFSPVPDPERKIGHVNPGWAAVL